MIHHHIHDFFRTLGSKFKGEHAEKTVSFFNFEVLRMYIPESSGGWREIQLLPPFMVHVVIVLGFAWIAVIRHWNFPFVILLGFLYLWDVERRQRKRIERSVRNYERRFSGRKRLLSDAETVRWLNSIIESIWPVCVEKFISERFLLPLAPWFLEKYKPWTAKKVVLKHLCLGGTAPVFTTARAGSNPTDGDHLVLEVGLDFVAGKDMSAVVAVQMRRRLGLGIWASFHISNLQLEGKLRVGVKVVNGWPVLERVRICFTEAPVIQMTVRPLFNYGVDVADLPGIAYWLDKMMTDALENSLVEPNLLVVDVAKLLNSLTVKEKASRHQPVNPGNWFHVEEKGPLAFLKVEVLEADNLKPADSNGKSDPYVRIIMGAVHHVTSIKKRTLQPAWHEEFQIPVISWSLPNLLILRVRDKDRFYDDDLGHSAVPIENLRDGERHEMWLRLDGVKTGRLHIAITVQENVDGQRKDDLQGDTQGSRTLSPKECNEGELTEEAYKSLQGKNVPFDLLDIPLKNQSEVINTAGMQAGAFSILTPGTAVCKESYNGEHLKHRKGLGRSSTVESKVDIPISNVQNLDDLATGTLNSETGDKKISKIGKFLRRNSPGKPKQCDLADNEIVAVGVKGTQIKTKLEVCEELQKDLAAMPDICDPQIDSDEEQEHHERNKKNYRNSSMKRIYKNVFKQASKTASKTAHHIGHAVHRKRNSGSRSKKSGGNCLSDESVPCSGEVDVEGLHQSGNIVDCKAQETQDCSSGHSGNISDNDLSHAREVLECGIPHSGSSIDCNSRSSQDCSLPHSGDAGLDASGTLLPVDHKMEGSTLSYSVGVSSSSGE